eukprot:1125790-Prymnesium_polylepis.1
MAEGMVAKAERHARRIAAGAEEARSTAAAIRASVGRPAGWFVVGTCARVSGAAEVTAGGGMRAGATWRRHWRGRSGGQRRGTGGRGHGPQLNVPGGQGGWRERDKRAAVGGWMDQGGASARVHMIGTAGHIY